MNTQLLDAGVQAYLAAKTDKEFDASVGLIRLAVMPAPEKAAPVASKPGPKPAAKPVQKQDPKATLKPGEHPIESIRWGKGPDKWHNLTIQHLKKNNIHSVEQLAAIPMTELQKMPYLRGTFGVMVAEGLKKAGIQTK